MKRRKKPTSVDKDSVRMSEVLNQAEVDLKVSINSHGAEKTAWDLHQILNAQEDDTKAHLNGLLSLRALLNSLLQSKEDTDTEKNTIVLEYYLENFNRHGTDFGDEHSFIQILQLLHASFQANKEKLLVSILSTIVLLLRAFDTVLRFQRYGSQLCNVLLRKQEAKLLSTCVASYKNRAQVISLATQILTELVSFDAGAVAWSIFAQRNYLLDYRILSRNLRIKDPLVVPSTLDFDTKSVRLETCIYLMANLKYQRGSVKTDILKQRDLMQGFFDDLVNDPIDIVKNVLNVVRTCVIFDTSLPRSSKGAIWTLRILRSITDIMRSDEADFESTKQNKNSQSLALDLIVQVCTTAEAGLLIPDTNWHLPEGRLFKEAEERYQDPLQLMEVELYSLDRHTDHTRLLAIKNRILGEFILQLRPCVKANEFRVLVETLRAAPELVAYYFYRKSNFPLEPKLSSEWLGFSSLVHSVTRLPLYRFAESWPPPPTYVTIESILPLPFSQRVFRRCLNHKSSFIRFLSTKYLLSALEKLKKVRKKFMDFSSSRFSIIWEKASNQLAVAFAQRCPETREILKIFKSTPSSSILQYEIASALVELYYEAIPQVALKEHFDMSLNLCDALQDDTYGTHFHRQLGSNNLCRLVNIAKYSSSVRWFSKSEKMNISPFSILLVYSLDFKKKQNVSAMKDLLDTILCDHDVFQQLTSPSTFDAVKASLSSLEFHTLNTVIKFFDECCVRCARKPLKYHDDLDKIISLSQLKKGKPLSAFWAAIVEQWSFAQSSAQYDLKIIAGWISACLALCCEVGEDDQVLFVIKENLINNTEDFESKEELQTAVPYRLFKLPKNWFEKRQQVINLASYSDDHETQSKEIPITNPYFSPIQPEDDNYQGLRVRLQDDVEQSIIDGTIGGMIICLCARPMGIRKEALVNLRKVRHVLTNSNYSESLQIWLVLSELEETAEQIIPYQPLPHVIGSFAKSAISILANPTHLLYSKINKFLNIAPSWRIPQFTSYWVDQTLLNAPEAGVGYYIEVEWLLNILFEGLKCQEDLDILRSQGSIEHIFAIFNSPSIPERLKTLVLGLLWRIAIIGGSTTLMMRFGIVCWIKTQMVMNYCHRHDLILLAGKLEETCGDVRLHSWNSNDYDGCIAELRKIRSQNDIISSN